MKRTWFRNFAVKLKWLLCSKKNTFLPSSPLFLNRTQFNNHVRKYDGNRYVKHFTCWNQLLAMMFGQLSNRESLRDLIVAFEAHRAKQYHLGLGRKPIAKTTFASANQNRDYRIFEDFAFYMMEQARKKRVTDIFKLKGNVYAFDSTTIPSSFLPYLYSIRLRLKGNEGNSLWIRFLLCFRPWI